MPDITKGTTFSDGQEVTASDLNSLLDSASINSLAITEAKLADGAVSSAKLGSGAIDYSKLESLADGKIVVGNAGTATAATLAGAATISYDSSTGNATITLDPESITEQTAKGSTAHNNDVLLVVDSEDSNVLKKIVVSELPTGSSGDTIPTGCIFPFAGGILPTQWLFCNGAEVSRVTYDTLFSAIGTAYGIGNGTSTFDLPDLGGRVPAGKESSATRLTTGGSGIDGDTLGSSGGSEDVTAAMPSHTHSFSGSDGGHSHTITHSPPSGKSILHYSIADLGSSSTTHAMHRTGTPRSVQSSIALGDYLSNASATVTVSGTTGSTGAGGDTNVTQPTLIVNYIIKY